MPTYHFQKFRKLCVSLEIRHFAGLQLKLQLVSDKRNKLRIGRLSLGVGYRVAKEPLQCIQIAPIPGDLDGVADGPLHPGRGGLEGFGYLGIQHLGDGVGVPYGPPEGLAGCSRRTL